MKISLDITKLLEEGRITQAEHDKLKLLAAKGSGSVGFNILIGFGVVAVTAGFMGLVPSFPTAIATGIACLLSGMYLNHVYKEQWGILGAICTLVGAVLMGAGVIGLLDASTFAFISIAIIFILAGIIAKSGLLMALSVLAIFASIGASTGYFHAFYSLTVEAPLLTVVLFGALAALSYMFTRNLAADYQRLGLIFAGTSLFMVNLGFWIGSLWGGGDGSSRDFDFSTGISELAFTFTWAIALVGVGIWGVMKSNRWVINLSAVFGSIHFYTQWFERLGATPGSIFAAGIMALVIAIVLGHYNQVLKRGAVPISSSFNEPEDEIGRD